MDNGILVPIALFVCITASLIGVPLAIALARRVERGTGGKNDALPSPAVIERLDRMEQAIDAIAVEVERISEGQRFTTKLLSERPASQAAQTSQTSQTSQLPPGDTKA